MFTKTIYLMKIVFKRTLALLAFAVPVAGLAQENTSPGAVRELKQAELLPIAFVKFQHPSELIAEVVAASRTLDMESETALLPFLVGGMLGDPELKSFAADADINLVLLNALDRPQPYVFLVKFTPDAPARAKLEEMGLKIGQLGDWSILARNPEFIRRLEGSKSLYSIAMKKRAADIEIGLWTDRLATQIDAQKALFLSLLAANSEVFQAQDTQTSIGGMIDVMNGELRAMEYFMIGLNLSEEKITTQLQLKGKEGTPLAAYLSAKVGGTVRGSEYISKKGMLYGVSYMNTAAIESYLSYLLEKSIAATRGTVAAFFSETLLLNNQIWDFYDGDSALAVTLDGAGKPVMQQAIGSKYSPAEAVKLTQGLIEGYLTKVQALLPSEAQGSVDLSLEAKEDVFNVAGISVMELVTTTTVDQKAARISAIEEMLEEAVATQNQDMEADARRMLEEIMAEGPSQQVITESTFMASHGGVMYTATNRSDMAIILKAAEAGEPLPNNLSSITLPDGCLAIFNYDLAFFAEIMAAEIAKEDPQMAEALKSRLASVSMEPVSVAMFQGEGKLSIVSETPLKSIGEIIKASKASQTE